MAVADKLVNLADLKVAYDDNAGKISDLKSALDASEGSLFNASMETIGAGLLQFRSGYYRTANDPTQNGDYVSQPLYAGVRIACNAGDSFRVHLYGGAGVQRAWAFYNADNGLISRESRTRQLIDDTITAGTGAAYVVFNNDLENFSSGYYVYKGTSIKDIVDGKQDMLTFDTSPAPESKNPVTSDGVNNELEMLRAALGKQLENIGGITPTFDEYWNSENETATIVSYNGYKRSDAIPVTPGENYYIRMLCASSEKQNPILIVDSNYNILQRYTGTRNAINEYTFKIPNGAAFMLLTTRDSGAFTNVNLYEIKSTDDLKRDIENELDEIREAIGSNEVVAGSIDQMNQYWYSKGGVGTNAVLTQYNGYHSSSPIAVNPGETYRIDIYSSNSGNQNPVVLAEFDGSNYVIKETYRGTKNAQNEFNFIVPDGVTHILLTTNGDHTGVCYKTELNHTGGAQGMFDYKGANIAIVGDSISTNGNYSSGNPLGNVPEIIVQSEDVGVQLSAYATYYDIGTSIGGYTITAEDVGNEITFTPVAGDVGKIIGKPDNNNAASTYVWWEVASEVLGFNPIPVAWSGSSITSHEKDTDTYKASYAWHDSQIRKCGIRTPGSMTRTAPDMIIIYRGTNDMTHTPYARLTDYLDTYPALYPETDEYDDNGETRYDYVRGMLLTIKKLREAYPEARIVLCTLNYFRRVIYNENVFPTRNGVNSLPEYNNMIRKIADYCGCDLIEFDKDGLTHANAWNGYYNETGNNPTHPNSKGHKVMGNRALRDLARINSLV